jgi:hypothetical protein
MLMMSDTRRNCHGCRNIGGNPYGGAGCTVCFLDAINQLTEALLAADVVGEAEPTATPEPEETVTVEPARHQGTPEVSELIELADNSAPLERVC